MHMNIGIVTVLYNSESVIDEFIDSLNAQMFQCFHVYFVENETDSRVCEEVIQRRAAFRYTFVRNQKNVGVAAANNQGLDFFLDNSSYTHVLLINNDVVFGPRFLLKQVSIFADYPRVFVLAPKTFYHGDPDKVWYAGGSLSYLKGGVRHFGHNKRDRLVGKPLFHVTYAPTCSMMLRADKLRECRIRMWEELFVYADDYQFCMDLRASGIEICYAPDIHLWHKISVSTGGSRSEFSRYYLVRNWFYLGLVHRNLAVLLVAPIRAVAWALIRRRVELRALGDGWQMARRRREPA